jgi:hypothetical protein
MSANGYRTQRGSVKRKIRDIDTAWGEFNNYRQAACYFAPAVGSIIVQLHLSPCRYKSYGGFPTVGGLDKGGTLSRRRAQNEYAAADIGATAYLRSPVRYPARLHVMHEVQ